MSKIMTKPCRYLLAGLTLCAGTIGDSGAAPSDLRVAKLETFFLSYGCPTPHHAFEYVRAADAYQVDYRVLPAISLLESTCGEYGRRNNFWGWAGALKGFESIPAGIAFVTRQLADGSPYRDKALDEKLFTYNPRSRYVREVRRLMVMIDPEDVSFTDEVER
jgi:hypothetical protein